MSTIPWLLIKMRLLLPSIRVAMHENQFNFGIYQGRTLWSVNDHTSIGHINWFYVGIFGNKEY